jgi:hypothetical protein
MPINNMILHNYYEIKIKQVKLKSPSGNTEIRNRRSGDRKTDIHPN